MSNVLQNSGKEKDEISPSFKWAIYFISAFALALIVVSHLFYWTLRGDFKNSDGSTFGEDKWGQYGDFIGGITNPFLSFLTFGGLLYTILIQRRELALQRTELANSSQALMATEEEIRQTRKIAADQAEFNKIESKKNDIEKALTRISIDIDTAFDYQVDLNHYTVRQVFLQNANAYLISYVNKEKPSGEYDRKINSSISNIIFLNDFAESYGKYEYNLALLKYYLIKYNDIIAAIVDADILEESDIAALISVRNP